MFKLVYIEFYCFKLIYIEFYCFKLFYTLLSHIDSYYFTLFFIILCKTKLCQVHYLLFSLMMSAYFGNLSSTIIVTIKISIAYSTE